MPTSLSSGIYQMQLNDDELTLGGYLETQDDFEKLFLISESEQIEIPVKSLSTSQNGYFSTVISLSTLTNGTYNLVDDKQNKLEEKGAIVTSYRLGRFHINDKLVSFFYEDGIQIKIEDFEYLYDIVIDPGHGGIDIGAEGISIYERDLNLKISLYEKERYEEHGLKVHLIRQGVNYPKLIGDADWTIVQKVGYTLGWYGAVSHYTYSNHHNADTYGYATGPEIVVPGRATKEELSVAYRLLNDFKKVYPKITTYWPLYMRSYETGTNISRVKGNIVDERSWYGFIRYPEECFGVNVTLFESAYISNPHDNAWYVVQGHWKDVSEAKIRAYVEALGKTYIPPKK